MIDGLDANRQDWPIVFILKDGTRIAQTAAEILGRDYDGIFDVMCENQTDGSTAYFELTDVVCILT